MDFSWFFSWIGCWFFSWLVGVCNSEFIDCSGSVFITSLYWLFWWAFANFVADSTFMANWVFICGSCIVWFSAWGSSTILWSWSGTIIIIIFWFSIISWVMWSWSWSRFIVRFSKFYHRFIGSIWIFGSTSWSGVMIWFWSMPTIAFRSTSITFIFIIFIIFIISITWSWSSSPTVSREWSWSTQSFWFWWKWSRSGIGSLSWIRSWRFK